MKLTFGFKFLNSQLSLILLTLVMHIKALIQEILPYGFMTQSLNSLVMSLMNFIITLNSSVIHSTLIGGEVVTQVAMEEAMEAMEAMALLEDQ